MLNHHDEFEHEGREYRITIIRDDYMGAPWEEHDGHGPVSDWRSKGWRGNYPKEPGERLLHEYRGAARFYDWAEAMKIARRDGWAASQADAARWHAGEITAGQRAERAVAADFEYLRRWCEDEWWWVTVTVTQRCACCDDFTGLSVSVGGIESDAGEYFWDVARDLAEEIAATEKEAA